MSTRTQPVRQRASDQTGADDHHPHRDGLLARAWRSGSTASLLSTLAISIFSRTRSGATAAGTNAASQWLWYPQARHARRPSLKHTVSGYAIHHASSLLWGCAFEALSPRRVPPGRRAQRAAAVAALAYLVDYHVVPRRFSPGFGHRIGRLGMCAAYASFAIGLFASASTTEGRHAQATPGARTPRALRRGTGARGQ